MDIIDSKFVGSYPTVSQCPKADRPEYAFCGRSNVGKSSLINMLMDKKKLAKTSNTPGKTQLLNFFEVDDSWYLVDLPGYGYAQVSKKSRNEWHSMIHQYLTKRTNLIAVFVLIDSMIPPQQIDLDFIDLLGEEAIPFCLVFTKLDRIKEKDAEKNIQLFADRLLEHWEELPPVFRTSSKTRLGRKEMLDYILTVNDELIDVFNAR